jgi:hypothetical protein
MSNYTKTTNFTAKDSLPSGNAGKIVKGSDFDTEFDNIATAIATKQDIASLGTMGTQNANNVTITGGTMSGMTSIADADGNVRGIQKSGSTKTTSYTLVAADAGNFIQVESGGSIVVPTSVFTAGDSVIIFNNTTGDMTITCSAVTAYVGGISSAKTSATLATRGIATILFVTSSLAVIVGNVK